MKLQEWLPFVKIFVVHMHTPQRSPSADKDFNNHMYKMTHTVHIIQFLQPPCAYTMNPSKKYHNVSNVITELFLTRSYQVCNHLTAEKNVVLYTEPFPGGRLITLDKFYHGWGSYLLSKEQKYIVGIELHFLPKHY